MKLYAVSIKLSRDSKWDYEESHLLFAENADEAKSKVQKKREEVDYEEYYSYEVEEVNLERLKSGESILVYAKYHN